MAVSALRLFLAVPEFGLQYDSLLGPNMVNDSPFGVLSHLWRIYGSGFIFRENDWQNLTLMHLNQDSCQLVPIWLMALPL